MSRDLEYDRDSYGDPFNAFRGDTKMSAYLDVDSGMFDNVMDRLYIGRARHIKVSLSLVMYYTDSVSTAMCDLSISRALEIYNIEIGKQEIGKRRYGNSRLIWYNTEYKPPVKGSFAYKCLEAAARIIKDQSLSNDTILDIVYGGNSVIRVK